MATPSLDRTNEMRPVGGSRRGTGRAVDSRPPCPSPSCGRPAGPSALVRCSQATSVPSLHRRSPTSRAAISAVNSPIGKMMRSRLSVARGSESLPITPLRASGDVPWSISAGAALIEMPQPGLSYSPPSRSSRFSRAASASASRGAGSSTATPGGTASPGSMSEFRRLLEADLLGFAPRAATAAWLLVRPPSSPSERPLPQIPQSGQRPTWQPGSSPGFWRATSHWRVRAFPPAPAAHPC
jgi:hypothetical protein